jgi:hypothetical protein
MVIAIAYIAVQDERSATLITQANGGDRAGDRSRAVSSLAADTRGAASPICHLSFVRTCMDMTA